MSARRFRRTLASLAGIFEFVAEFAKAERLDATRTFEAELVLEELFTNQVKYNPATTREVEIRLQRKAQTVVLTLRDPDADRFDPTQAPPAALDLPLTARQPGGLGLRLVRRIAGSMRYDYRDRCSTITVTLEPGP